MSLFRAGMVVNQRHRVVRPLGAGGMGEVYLVEDLLAGGRLLALKTVRSAAENPATLDSLKREFEAMTRFRHPNLAGVYDFGRLAGEEAHFFTMEYVEGADLLDATETLGVGELCSLLVQLCRALEYLHSRGFLHRDLKPSNILVAGGGTPSPTVKVLDFGLLSETAGLREGGEAGGTLHYMAPEVLRGHPAESSADLYSLGVVLYQVLTRRVPFDGATPEEVVRQHLHEPPPPADGADSKRTAALWPVIAKLLAKEPADRYASATEVIAALSESSGLSLETEADDTIEGYLSSSPFVGRERELAALQEQFRRLGSPDHPERAVLIEGVAGVGKSRLLQEFRYFCQLNGGGFFLSNCRPAGAGAGPGEPLSEVLRQALAGAGVDLGESGSDLVSLCAAAARYAGSELPDVRGRLDPAQLTLHLADTMLRFLEASGRDRPFVVAFDDVQWADGPTAEMLGYLARNALGGPFLVCLAYRREEVKGTASQALIDEFATEPAVRVPLESLTSTAVSTMVNSMLGQVEFPAEFLDRFTEDTGGNPFFAIELLRLHAQEGTLYRGAGGWQVNESAAQEPVRVPASVRELVERRVRALPRDALGVLEALAVLARRAHPELVADMLSASADAVAGAVVRLLDADLVKRDPDTGLVGLCHSEIGRTLYTTLAESDRRRLHAQAGEALERLCADSADERVVQLARHFLRAGDAPRGVQYGLTAAESLKAASANNEAREFYENVQSLADPADVSTELRIREGLAEVYRFVGERDRGLRCCREAIQSCAGRAPSRSLIRLHRLMGTILEATGEFEEAQDHFALAHGLLRSVTPPREELAKLYECMGQLAIRRRNAAEAVRLSRLSLDALGTDHDNATAASVYTNMAVAHQLLQETDEALWCFDKSMAIRQRIGDREGLSRSLHNKGALHRRRGEYDHALRCYRQSLEIKTKVGNREGVAASHYNIGNVYCLQGEYELAREEYQGSLTIRERIGDKLGQVAALLGLAHVCRTTADYGGAQQSLKRCLALQEELGQDAAAPCTELAALHLDLGAHEEAEAAVERALTAGKSAARGFDRGMCLMLQGKIRLQRQEWESADHALRTALELFEERDSQEGIGETLLLLGRSALRQGDVEGADRLLARSREIDRQSGRSSLTSPLLCAQAEVRAARGDTTGALDLFQQAATLADAMSMPEALWRAQVGAAARHHEKEHYAAELACYETVLRVIKRICTHIGDAEQQLRYLGSGDRPALFRDLQSSVRDLERAL